MRCSRSSPTAFRRRSPATTGGRRFTLPSTATSFLRHSLFTRSRSRRARQGCPSRRKRSSRLLKPDQPCANTRWPMWQICTSICSAGSRHHNLRSTPIRIGRLPESGRVSMLPRRLPWPRGPRWSGLRARTSKLCRFAGTMGREVFFLRAIRPSLRSPTARTVSMRQQALRGRFPGKASRSAVMAAERWPLRYSRVVRPKHLLRFARLQIIPFPVPTSATVGARIPTH